MKELMLSNPWVLGAALLIFLAAFVILFYKIDKAKEAKDPYEYAFWLALMVSFLT